MDALRARGTLARDGKATPFLVGDDIENPGNAGCLRAAAAMFDWPYQPIGDHAAREALARSGVPIIALENSTNAEDLFKYRPPDGPFALVVGNERKGVSRELLRRASRIIEIPVYSAHLNCLNVAAAAAVALYRLARQSRQTATRGGRDGGRPAVLFAGIDDPIELGSALRSAACFGWTELAVLDHHAVWFDADRVTRSLGRGAARRGRNPIRVTPFASDAHYDEVCIIGTDDGEPLRFADLARGSRQLVVLGDAHRVDVARLAARVRHIRLEALPGAHPFRLVASIALAEVARQVG